MYYLIEKSRFKKIKEDEDKKHTGAAILLFTQYIISFLFFGLTFFGGYGFITGVNGHIHIDESSTSQNNESDSFVYIDGFISPTSFSRVYDFENAYLKEVDGLALTIYDKGKEHLLITKNDLNYLHCDVPNSLWDEINSEEFYIENIKNNYSCLSKTSSLFPCEKTTKEIGMQLSSELNYFITEEGVIVNKDGSRVSEKQLKDFDVLGRKREKSCLQIHFPDIMKPYSN